MENGGPLSIVWLSNITPSLYKHHCNLLLSTWLETFHIQNLRPPFYFPFQPLVVVCCPLRAFRALPQPPFPLTPENKKID